MIEKIINALEEESQYSCSHCMARAIEIVKEVAKEYESDLDLLINEFCVPSETEFICEELSDASWGIDEDYETWCGRNCGVINDGTCPSKECYKEWLKMKKSAPYQKGE